MTDLELIQRARNANLLKLPSFTQGYRLIKSGAREYRLEEHDSLVVSNNRWHWFSRNPRKNKNRVKRSKMPDRWALTKNLLGLMNIILESGDNKFIN